MQKTIVLLITILAFANITLSAQTRTCGAMHHLENELEKNPKRSVILDDIERQTALAISSGERVDGIITIPTVVHIIYNTSAQNISDAQIMSQMAILNQDFRRTNSDANSTWSQAADTEIEFCLASVDPNGNSTTGITRTSTTLNSFGTNDAMKYTAQGGHDAWPADQYMNMWVCVIGGGILGYAQFPGGNPATDGVVMDYQYFGNIGTASAPFDLGRTATHEVGHWLNLRHIWGDGNCNADDFVNDTPNSDGANYGCASGHISCNTTDMVENYMDYSDDACMNLFTQGQKARMRALFETGGAKASLLTSNGCGNGTIATCTDGIQNGDETGVDCGGSNCAACASNCTDNIVNFSLSLDNYPAETSWTLVNAAGQTVASGGSYGSLSPGTVVTEELCLADACYDFTINDTYGDGICCAYGNGSYSITSNGTTLASGGQFSNTETKNFCLGNTPTPTCTDGVMNGDETGIDCGGSCSPCSNASTALNMTLKGTWDGTNDDYNDVWGYVDGQGNEYAVIGSKAKVHFVNVTNPTTPTLVDEFTGVHAGINGASSIWRDFKTYDKYVYAVADQGNEGLMIFDMSALPGGSIVKANQDNSVFSKAHNIYIDAANARLYVVGSSSHLIIYDLAANPTNPTVIGNLSLPGGYIHDVFVQNNIAYASSGYNGMYIYDVTDAASPVFQASLNTGGYNHSSWITEDGTKLLYAEEVPSGRPLGFLDISNAANNDISIMNTFKDPLEANATNNVYHNPYIVDNYVVISSYEDGITIFDISNPANPTLAAYYDTYLANNGNGYTGYEGAWGVYPYFPSGNIIGSDIQSGLVVLSTSLTLTSDCGDGTQGLFEEGVDCGGFCAPCSTITTPTCTDGVMNGDETAIDCGGSTCPACPTCTDGVMNGDETAIDCGGSTCPACPTCTDGVMNGDETGVDCGGSSCPDCTTNCVGNVVNFSLILDNYPAETSWMLVDANGETIASGDSYGNLSPGTNITEEFCLLDACYDFIINDTYGDGICCAYGNGSYAFSSGGNTLISGGSFTSIETMNFCLGNNTPSCTDGQMNGDETGVDCGGSACPACPTCTDGIMNGDETAIDCGGSTCPPCNNGGCTEVLINSNNFDTGWGIWNDGGSDCWRSNQSAYAYSGSRSMRIRDNTNSSVATTDNLDLLDYEEVTVAFTYYARSMDNVNEDFWLQISTNGGGSYTTVEEWNRGDEFQNESREFDSVIIPGPFTTNTRLRFRCDASGNSDWVYIDDVVISGCLNNAGVRHIEDVAIRNSVSAALDATTTAPHLSALKVYPNPTNAMVNITFKSVLNSETHILVSNLNGKSVHQLQTNDSKTSIDVQNWAPGIYFIHIMNGDRRMTKKLIVQ